MDDFPLTFGLSFELTTKNDGKKRFSEVEA